MEVNNDSFDHLQECANGLRDLVAEGKLDTALKVATYLQREGQLAILNMKKGAVKDFYPKVTALLETLENSNIDSHPKLRHTVAKTARVFAQLAVDRMGEPFPEYIKNELLGKIAPRLEAAEVGKQFALRYELTCLREAVKGIDTGISLFNLSLAAGVIKGGAKLATGNGPDTLLALAQDAFKKMGAMWYPDALRLSWVGQMGKNDEETFAFFCEEVNQYVDLRCKLVDLEKRHVLIGLVDTFAEIAWTSRVANHRQTAALWIAKLADVTQPRTSLKAVRYRAVEQLVAMKEHHIDSIRALATLQLQSRQKTETKKMVLELVETTDGRENTGFRERPELVLPRRAIEHLLKSPVESKIDELIDGNAQVMKKLDGLDRSKRSPAEQAVSIIRLKSSHWNFVGRKAELENLHSYFFEGEWQYQQSCKVAFLYGMGGMGKTELALRFANDWRSEFSFVYTIPAESPETRAGAYRQLATQLGVFLEEKSTPDQVGKRLFAHLEGASFGKPYLLLYDNVKEELEFPTRNGHLLLTARNQKFAPKDLEVYKFELVPMEEKEGLILLKKWTEEEESPAMKELFHRLGGYPFVLAQAGAYIASNPLRTVAKYVEKHTVPPTTEDGYQQTLDQVLGVTLGALKEEASLAFEWLQVCAYLNPDNISLDYLEKHLASEEERENVVLCLTNRSLMHFENGMFSMHRHIQEALRKMDTEGEALKKASSLIAGIEFSFYTFDSFEQLQNQSTVWASHAELLLECEIPLSDHAQLLDQMGSFEREVLCQYEKGLSYHQQALDTYKKVYGDEHPAVAIFLSNIGSALESLGRSEEALTYHQKALAIEKRIYGQEHPDVAISLGSIGSALNRLGRYEEALEHYQKALAIRKKVNGDEHPDVAISLGSIGNALQSLGRSKEALNYQQQTLAIFRKVYGDEHPHAATSFSHIGTALESLGHSKEALTYHQQALAIRKKVYGQEHPHVASSLGSIGTAFYRLGSSEEALTYHKQALAIFKKVYGDEHPDVAISLSNIGTTLPSLHRYEEALTYHKQALAIEKKVYGQEHPSVAISLYNMGWVLAKMQDMKGAKECFQQALAIGEKVLPEDHPHLKLYRDSLAKLTGGSYVKRAVGGVVAVGGALLFSLWYTRDKKKK